MTLVKKKIEPANAIKYIKYKETAPDTVIALGTYLGHEMRKNLDANKPDVPLFKVQQDDGTTVGLNSASNLNPLLLDLSVGTVIEVTFKGFAKKKSKAGVPYTIGNFEVSELVEG